LYRKNDWVEYQLIVDQSSIRIRTEHYFIFETYSLRAYFNVRYFGLRFLSETLPVIFRCHFIAIALYYDNLYFTGKGRRQLFKKKEKNLSK